MSGYARVAGRFKSPRVRRVHGSRGEVVHLHHVCSELTMLSCPPDLSAPQASKATGHLCKVCGMILLNTFGHRLCLQTLDRPPWGDKIDKAPVTPGTCCLLPTCGLRQGRRSRPALSALMKKLFSLTAVPSSSQGHLSRQRLQSRVWRRPRLKSTCIAVCSVNAELRLQG